MPPTTMRRMLAYLVQPLDALVFADLVEGICHSLVGSSAVGVALRCLILEAEAGFDHPNGVGHYQREEASFSRCQHVECWRQLALTVPRLHVILRFHNKINFVVEREENLPL